jgi:hypothetical protein
MEQRQALSGNQAEECRSNFYNAYQLQIMVLVFPFLGSKM